MQRGLVWTLVLLAGGVSGGGADAQSNSLLRIGTGWTQAPPPTTQPASGVRAALPPPPAFRTYASASQDDDPPPNEVLLGVSLIGVEAPRPRQIMVNDLITVIVREEKRATTNSDLKSDKKWEITAELKKWIRINEQYKLVPQVFPQGNPALELDYEDKYQGKGKVGRKDSLITRITAKVIDVKPNGTLVLEARKNIKVDDDRQIATLTGICRSEDVTAQNTVLSTQLATARIDIQHSGPARNAARQGWLTRLWDEIRPF